MRIPIADAYLAKYGPEEDQARAARAWPGISADEFVPPWPWRRGQRLA